MNERKYKNIIINYLIYFVTFIVVILYGVTHVSALETKTIYSTNSSGTLSNSNKYTYGFINQGGVQTTSSASVNTTINGRALALIFYMNEPVVLNKTYTMEINFMSNDLISTFTSSMVEVATCNADVCNDNAIVSVTKSSPSGMSNKLTIQFNPITTGSILMVNLSDKTREFYITGLYNQQTFGIKSVTLDSTNQNQDIIDNQTNNTNNIINNNNSNTQEIINNQNENTQAIINAQYTCKTRSITLNNYIEYNSSYLTNTGDVGTTDNYAVTEYIKIQSNSPYTINLNYNSNNRYCFYDKNLNFLSCSTYGSIREINFTSGSSVEFIRFTIRTAGSATTFYGGNICLKDSQEQTNAINDLNDSLTNDSPIDMSSIGNTAGWLPPGPIDSIINLPLTMFNSLFSALNGTCQPLHVKIPYLNDKYIDIPCISTIFNNINGLPNFWTWFGGITSVLMLYRYLLALYKYYDDLTTLKANFLSDFGGVP